MHRKNTWLNRFKESKPRDTIKCLKDPMMNTPTRTSKEMAEIVAKYHKDVQSKDQNPQDPQMETPSTPC